MDQPRAPDGVDEPVQDAGVSPQHIAGDQASPAHHALPPKPVLDASASKFHPSTPTLSELQAQQRPETTQDRASIQNISATDLPVEILQHIFSFVSPLSLGRLLLTCRMFNALLDPTKPLPPASTSPPSGLTLQSQNDVWTQVRRNIAADHPRPMDDMTELEMWRLIRGSSCEFCSKKTKTKVPLLATSPWNAGPGPEGVRAIWPFRRRTCGPCLECRIVKVNQSRIPPKVPLTLSRRQTSCCRASLSCFMVFLSPSSPLR